VLTLRDLFSGYIVAVFIVNPAAPMNVSNNLGRQCFPGFRDALAQGGSDEIYLILFIHNQQFKVFKKEEGASESYRPKGNPAPSELQTKKTGILEKQLHK
jgi:hypothetical protein